MDFSLDQLLRPSPDGAFSELRDQAQHLAPEWESVLSALRNLAPADLKGFLAYITENIQNRGSIYNAYSEDGSTEPWESLSVIPYVISEQEWDFIELAVAQRAAVINDTLRDIYGPQQLIRRGLVPPSLIFGQRGFLWPCINTLDTHENHLHMYAVDIARDAQGQWRVLKDRTQGPLGAGYALQNRQIMSTALPALFNQLRVHPQTDYFRALRQTLLSSMSVEDGNVVTVLLSPGPKHPAYFEHVFLARQMGVPITESLDLTVRNDLLYLKTLRGLQRVHVVLRRLEDSECDPMELYGSDYPGIPGLLQAIRKGNVTVCNALGSGVLESAGMLEFLPGICQHLRGEPLLMDSIRSWWCGDEANLEYARKHFDSLMFKSSFSSMRASPQYVPDLNQVQREALLQRLETSPRSLVAHEVMPLARIPEIDLESQQLQMRRFTMRVFATLTHDGSYQVMPGGVVRVEDKSNTPVLSSRNRQINKDLWVCRAGRSAVPTEVTVPPVRARVRSVPDAFEAKPLTLEQLLAAHTTTPARIGENLFWMGRYGIRAELSVLLLRTIIRNLTERVTEKETLITLLYKLATDLHVLPVPSAQSIGDDDTYDINFIRHQLGASLAPSSLSGALNNNVNYLHQCAFNIRERLSLDVWWVVNYMPAYLGTTEFDLTVVQQRMQELFASCSILSGFTHEQMTRDEGWSFLLLGRLIEKLGRMSDTLGFFLKQSEHDKTIMLESLLEIAYSIVTYRARYHREEEMLAVLYLLVFDRSNPYSLRYLCQSLLDNSAAFSVQEAQSRQILQKALGDMDAIDLARFAVGTPAADQIYQQLANVCADISYGLSIYANSISHQYFLVTETITSDTGLEAANKEFL
ncbi:hypothetical protein TKWG_24680 [Advenella kashmirensis WT001]|uniref:Uncharacterized protein n=1 Tax=Advenella kashmirensis (strain DSM 17095 / LMG 22695 / WT001) TaxID=1036672 RepID=I3UHK3_ADVKW|nr:circularly permuted type 2 ATP-grasp protein [Advenella kashmirensis]AFK64491.1 hypothetical protein TKWG_24680 [Advenella kashmirensis WT001]